MLTAWKMWPIMPRLICRTQIDFKKHAAPDNELHAIVIYSLKYLTLISYSVSMCSRTRVLEHVKMGAIAYLNRVLQKTASDNEYAELSQKCSYN